MVGSNIQSVPVALGERSYSVEVGVGLLEALGERLRSVVGAERPVRGAGPHWKARRPAQLHQRNSRAFLVVDDNLPTALVAAAVGSLETVGFTVTAERVTATEPNKSIATLERLLVALAATGHERAEPVVALGGGIVGDLAGFAAAIYRRGIPVIQCPTTLLAMVDASVGGKTGVNLAVGGSLLKNMAGAFWQPRVVLADPAALRSLGDRQFRAGLSECIKHGMIAGDFDPTLAEWTRSALPRLHCRDETALVELVARNVSLKARVVEGDELERADCGAGRAILNLGHTFAHAIETLPNLTADGDPAHAPLFHGEAVALGLVAATATSAAIGLVGAELLDHVRILLTEAGLPVAVADLPSNKDILTSMRRDKKVAGDRIRLVLPSGPGVATVMDDVSHAVIETGIAAIRLEKNTSSASCGRAGHGRG